MATEIAKTNMENREDGAAEQKSRPVGRHTPVPMAPGYFASEDGRIFSATGWRGKSYRELIQDLNSYGYPSVRVVINGRRRRIAVHRLIASAFIGEKPTVFHQLRHLDGDQTNNSKTNLAWGTAADNAADRGQHGRTSKGKRHSAAIKRGLERFVS
jgi:hypothetical protein